MKTNHEIENLKKLSENVVQAYGKYKIGEIEMDFFKIRESIFYDYVNNCSQKLEAYIIETNMKLGILAIKLRLESNRMQKKILNHE